MLFVIEGLDRTGKTTLATRIAHKVGGKIIHAGPPVDASIEEYETAINGYDPRGSEHLILDRWHVGEFVWPRIFGRETDMDDSVKKHVSMFMQSRGAITIQGVRDLNFLRKELVENDEPLDPDDIYNAAAMFESAFDFIGEPVNTWNYEWDSPDKIDTFIEYARNKAATASAIWNVCGPGFITGSLFPEVLLVGDEQGPKKENRDEPWKVPFAPYPSTSGHYLMKALPFWRQTAVINAHDRDRQLKYDIHTLWRTLDYPKVIGLGKNACERLEHLEIEHACVPHPQYWRRFHHHDVEGYTKLLEEARSGISSAR